MPAAGTDLAGYAEGSPTRFGGYKYGLYDHAPAKRKRNLLKKHSDFKSREQENQSCTRCRVVRLTMVPDTPTVRTNRTDSMLTMGPKYEEMNLGKKISRT